MTCEVNTAIKLKGSEGAIFTYEGMIQVHM